MKRRRTVRLGRLAASFAGWLYRYPAVLYLLPYGVFFPLLDSRGLYEYGDANFPLNPFWIDYILPWSGAASAGADNTFIGVPRLVYHLGINVLIAVFHNLQVAQWLWYSTMTVAGLAGAFVLARRLGAGRYAVPLSVFYAFNLWSYDRVAQGPIYLAYQALPLAIWAFLRYLDRPRLASALYFGCSLLLVIPSPQISYLAAVMCLFAAIRAIVLRGITLLLPLAGLAAAVIAVNAFYVFSMAADQWLNAGGNIALVNQRFNIGVFQHYAANVSLLNTATLQSFYYTSVARQMEIVRVGVALLPLLLVALLLLTRPPRLRSRFYAGFGLVLLGLWLVDGIALLPDAYAAFHFAVPGLRSFVEPDYFSPLYLLGAFVMLATAVRLGTRAYGTWWTAAVWLVALSGILPFLPIFGPASGLPRASQPRQYRDFSHASVQGNTLWIPARRGVQYRWSPYVINGFTSLNSPSDAIGPTMAEWVSRGTARVQQRLSDAFVAGQLQTVRALALRLGVGTVAIAADSLSDAGQWPDPDVVSAMQTFDALSRSGFLRVRSDRTEGLVHLITGTTLPPLPDVGLYGAPQATGTFDDFMWRLAAGPPAYRPIAADATHAESGVALRSVSPPKTTLRRMSLRRLHYSDCTPAGGLRIPAGNGPMHVVTAGFQRCLSFALPATAAIAAVQLTLDAVPSEVAQMHLTFHRRGGEIAQVDPALPAQEVPAGTTSATAQIVIPPNADVTLRSLTMRTMRRGAAAPPLPPGDCHVSDAGWQERNPMEYDVQAGANGRCTLVFRQSYAPIWTLERLAGSAVVHQHLMVDGFANGWVIDARGPIVLRIVNRALYAYEAGMALTLLSVVLAIALALRERLRWAARRTQRVATPA
jgi:hypothetical protein